jgi:hypothetical protein
MHIVDEQHKENLYYQEADIDKKQHLIQREFTWTAIDNNKNPPK